MNWYLLALKKYAVFSGRSRRKEYWLFFLFNFLITIALLFIDGMVGTFDAQAGIGLFGAIYALGILVPGIAVSVRRLHDTDRSGWWLLILFIPLIGAIVYLVFTVLDSTPGDNRHGPNPKDVTS